MNGRKNEQWRKKGKQIQLVKMHSTSTLSQAHASSSLKLSLEDDRASNTGERMHPWAVNNLVDAGPEGTELRFGCNNTPICPKPRRAGSTVPDILKQHTCIKHSQQNTDGRSQILNMIVEKSNDGRETVCTGCSPSCFSVSPPGRTENPLVHDVQFVHQMEVLSPFTRTKLSNKFGGFTSASPL